MITTAAIELPRIGTTPSTIMKTPSGTKYGTPRIASVVPITTPPIVATIAVPAT
jgi:hypothetical protein